jgi:type VI secretion system protein VasD
MHLLKFCMPSVLCALLLGLGANSLFAQEVREPTKLLLVIKTTANANPDLAGRPAPIKVRVYELKDSQTFSEADFFVLDSADKTQLGADLLAKDEYVLHPDAVQVIERKSNPQTTAIGIIAGYRDLKGTTWRVVHKLKETPAAAWYRALNPLNKTELYIQLHPQGLVLSDEK